jgi:hypothetical protein
MIMPAPGPNASNTDKIKWILEGYEDPTKFITEEETDTDKLQEDVAKVDIKDDNEVDLEAQIQRDFVYIGGPDVLLKKKKEPEEEKPTDNKQDASTSS